MNKLPPHDVKEDKDEDDIGSRQVFSSGIKKKNVKY